MLKNEKSANRNDHQNRKTEVFYNKNRKTDLKNNQNRKTENPNAPLWKKYAFYHIFINANEILGELVFENMISSHVKITSKLSLHVHYE